MKILKIENRIGKFSIDGAEYRDIENIEKKDLLAILDNIYSGEHCECDDPSVENIDNMASKIVYEKIFEKICEFQNSVEEIKKEIELEFEEAKNKYK